MLSSCLELVRQQAGPSIKAALSQLSDFTLVGSARGSQVLNTQSCIPRSTVGLAVCLRGDCDLTVLA